jgi:iron complex outermembrane receptor protein
MSSISTVPIGTARRTVRVLAGAVAALAFAAPGWSEPASSDDPFSMVREAVTVTGAAKRPQPISETPSMVTVITAAEIRAHGHRTLADALRWVRGAFVTYDRNYSYVGMRGLQRPGDYNNKILLTLDGHTMNGNVYGDGLFGNELGLDLETVERIEVVRGPGSALYGSHAVLAVVNVVTRRPSREPGVTMSARTGEGRERRVFGALASSRPGRPAWSVAGSWLGARGADLYFPEFDDPLTHGGMAIDADGEEAHAIFGTAEWKGLRLTARRNERMKRIPTGAFGTTFGDRRSRTYDGHDFVELAGARRLSAALELHGRLYWDAAHYHGFYVYGPDTATVVNADAGRGDVIGAEWRGHWSPVPGQVLTFGAEGQAHPRTELLNYDLDPYALVLDRRVRRHLLAAYVQNERRIGAATVTAGMRLDGYPGFAPVFSPRADLVWRLTPRLSWKLLAGSSFRAPSVYEAWYEDAVTVIHPGLGPERVITVESGLVRASHAATWTLSAYVNRIRGLIDLLPLDTSGTQHFANRERVLSRGIESEVEIVRPSGTRARLALACQTSEDEDLDAELTNSPRWNAHVALTHAPAEGGVSFGGGVRALSPRLTLAGARTDWAVIADARVGARIARGVEIGVEGRNLLDARYGDPGSGEHLLDQIAQDGRAAAVTITVRPAPRP